MPARKVEGENVGGVGKAFSGLGASVKQFRSEVVQFQPPPSERITLERRNRSAECPTRTLRPPATVEETISLVPGGTAADGESALRVPDRVQDDFRQTREWRTADDHRYEVEGEYARGGIGRILRAHDSDLDRPVALKELIDGDEFTEARFIREALVTARLQHPAIVPVYEAGRWKNGKPFYAMRMICGRSLAAVMKESRTLSERLALVPNVIAVADAMAYAHGQGVIHRDLKPSNVLIGAFGETQVVDWGLAADLTEASNEPWANGLYQTAASGLTVAGAVLGTPQYMPIEQAQGKSVDARADVYAIGAILYQLLAGTPPYDGKTTSEVLAKVTKEEPIPIQKRQPGIPQELATIVGKAMSREATGRYPSAKELADDLKRFQTGQLVSAHKYTKLMLVRRWLTRHRSLTMLAAVFGLFAIIGGSLAVNRVVRERNAVRASRNELLLVQARTTLERDPTTALAWLKAYAATNADLSSAEDMAVEAESLGVAQHVFRRTYNKPSGVAFSPDGKLLASAGPNSSARIYDVATGAIVAELPYGGEIRAIQFSPTASLAMWSDWESANIVVWNFQTGETRILRGHAGVIYQTFFSPDGRSIASAGDDATVRLWNIEKGTSRVLYNHTGPVRFLHFTADNRYLISTGRDDLIIWDVDLDVRRYFKTVGPAPKSFVSPGGDRFAYTTSDGTIEVWNAHSLERLGRFQLEPASWVLSFSKDGRLILAAGSNGMIRLLDLERNSSSLFLGHKGFVRGALLSSDNKIIVSGGQDATIRVWDVATLQSRALHGHHGAVSILLSPDENYLASTGFDGTVRLWAMKQIRRFVDARLGHSDQIQAVAFSPDGKLIASGGRDHTVRVWDLTGPISPRVYSHNNLVLKVRFSADSTRLASAGFGSSVSVWNLNDGIKTELSSNQKIVWDVQFSHSGYFLASAGADGSVRIWDGSSGLLQWVGWHKSEVTAIAFSSDDGFIASASNDGEVKQWNTSGGASKTVSQHENLARGFALSPDDRFLASAGEDGRIYLSDLINHTERVLNGHRARVRALKFTSNGKQLVSAGTEGTVRLWDAETGSVRTLSELPMEMRQIDISPQNTFVAAASWDNTVRVWDLLTGRLRRVVHHDDLVMDVAFSPSGRLVVSGGTDKLVRLMSLPASDPHPAPAKFIAHLNDLTSATLTRGTGLVTPDLRGFHVEADKMAEETNNAVSEK